MDVRPTRVLLATDGSKDACPGRPRRGRRVRGNGCRAARGPRGHTVPTARLRAFMRAEFKRQGQELLEKGVKQAQETGGRVAEAHLVEGRAADEILHLAGEIGAGLVVIGSRGLGTVGRIALGSVSEGIVHNADCPVLVLRGGEGAWPPERVVFGDDGSAAARASGDLAAVLLRAPRRPGPGVARPPPAAGDGRRGTRGRPADGGRRAQAGREGSRGAGG